MLFEFKIPGVIQREVKSIVAQSRQTGRNNYCHKAILDLCELGFVRTRLVCDIRPELLSVIVSYSYYISQSLIAPHNMPAAAAKQWTEEWISFLNAATTSGQ